MNGQHDIMIEILRRYRLDRPLPPEVRRRFSRRFGPVFAEIMKKKGLYTFLFGLYSSLYFTGKKLAALVSLKLLLAVALAAALVTGSIIAYLILSAPSVIAPAGDEVARISIPDAIKDPGGKGRGVIGFTLGVYPIKSSSVGGDVLLKVNGSLRREMEKLKGSGFATFAPRGVQTGYTMTGYIERMDESIILFVRVVNSTTSAIALVAREKIQNDDEIDRACETISRSVADAVK